jgi:endoglucanase
MLTNHLLIEGAPYITGKGVAAIIDIHNYGARRLVVGGVSEYMGKFNHQMIYFPDLWTRLANEFKGNPLVLFNLMNEPGTYNASYSADYQAKMWVNVFAQMAIDAIRETGAKNWIMVPGYKWTGAHDFISSRAAERFLHLRDPLHRCVGELHQYLDRYNSGTTTDYPAGKGATILQNVTAWAREHGWMLFLGEFHSINPALFAAQAKEVTDMLDYMEDNQDVWAGWTCWQLCEWEAESPFQLKPRADGTHSPAFGLIRPYLADQ